MNFLLNAHDAFEEKKGNTIITLSSEDTTDGLLIKIFDNGCGIPKEILPKIFDPFFTTKNVGKGTGLGLSICHSIIESFGGKTSVESNVGVGTQFSVLLPKI